MQSLSASAGEPEQAPVPRHQCHHRHSRHEDHEDHPHYVMTRVLHCSLLCRCPLSTQRPVSAATGDMCPGARPGPPPGAGLAAD